MCLIAIAPRGTDKYGKEFFTGLENSIIRNKDGIGFAYKRALDHSVYYAKGIKTLEAFRGILRTHELALEDELVVHLRYGNKGLINEAMTHPFLCNTDYSSLEEGAELFGEVTDPLMFHNGTLTDYYHYISSDQSDSFNFAKEFMSVPELQDYLKRDPSDFYQTFSKIIGSNKLVFLYPGDKTKVIHLGHFETAGDYLYSNDSYKVEPVIASSRYQFPWETERGRKYQQRGRSLQEMNAQYDEYEDDEAYRYPYAVRTQQSIEFAISEVATAEEEVADVPVRDINDLQRLYHGEVTSLNYMDFNFISKKANKQYSSLLIGTAYKIEDWTVSAYLTPSKTIQTLTCHIGNRINYQAVVTDELMDIFYITPRPEVAQIYEDLRALRKQSPSKNHWKRIRKFLTERLYKFTSSQLPYKDSRREYYVDKRAMCYFYLENLRKLGITDPIEVLKQEKLISQALTSSDLAHYKAMLKPAKKRVETTT